MNTTIQFTKAQLVTMRRKQLAGLNPNSEEYKKIIEEYKNRIEGANLTKGLDEVIQATSMKNGYVRRYNKNAIKTRKNRLRQIRESVRFKQENRLSRKLQRPNNWKSNGFRTKGWRSNGHKRYIQSMKNKKNKPATIGELANELRNNSNDKSNEVDLDPDKSYSVNEIKLNSHEIDLDEPYSENEIDLDETDLENKSKPKQRRINV